MGWEHLASWGEVVRHNALRHGGKPAFVSSDRAVSFEGYNRRINRLVDFLSQHGIRRGDRVAILSRNRIEMLETIGVAKAGVIPVPLNWRLSPRELTALIQDCAPAALFVDGELAAVADEFRRDIGSVRLFVAYGEPRQDWSNFEADLAAAEDREPEGEALRPDDPACIVYTSGTTGRPKGAVITHGGALANARDVAGPTLRLTPADVALAAMPFFHIGGMWYFLSPNFCAGCTSVILPEFAPAAVRAAIGAYKITNIHLVPTMINALLQPPMLQPGAFDSLRVIYYAASPMPLDLLQRAMAAFPHIDFVQGYGSTESGVTTMLSAADHRIGQKDAAFERLLQSCGRAIGKTEIRIARAGGADAPLDEIGEILVRSDKTMAGYWANPAATAATLVDGWIHTGDLGHLSQDGALTIVDRKHDMIISGGENVYPRDVEEVLYRDPDLVEAAVIGVPDPVWIERVVAVVVAKPGSTVTAERVIARARTQLAGYKCPKSVFFMDELPKSGAGKVVKKELRRIFRDAATAGGKAAVPTP